MKITKSTWAAVGTSLLLAACGGGGGSTGSQNNNPGRGELMQSPPPRITSLTAADYNARLVGTSSGQGLLTLSSGVPTGGTVPCGIDVQYIKYGTVGANGEATTASAALMVPTGTNAACTGPRPIVLHAHGTAVEKRYNLADFTDDTNPAYKEAQVLAALYAGNGYIVVAPNYAGYDSSTLSYHPFLVASQQSKDMLDALVAAKSAMPTLISGATASGKVYLSGYSQGGHVALATHRAMITDPATVAKLASLNLTVRASAPMSGVFATKSFGDQIVGGAVNAGSTTLLPMLITGYQKSYGNLYAAPSEVYESTYSSGIESLFPGSLSYADLTANGKVPTAALFDTASLPAAPAGALNTLWSAGFGTPNLIKSTYRTTYLADVATNNATPAHPLRVGLKANDLTTMTTPVGATMLCAGGNDPTVYYATNTGAMTTLWNSYLATPSAPTNPVTVVNMDIYPATTGTTGDPFKTLKESFTALNPPTSAAYATTYHSAVLPYCVRAARSYFALVN